MVRGSQRIKREVLASTHDGIPIIAESYVAGKRLNTPFRGEKLSLYDTLKGRSKSRIPTSSTGDVK